MLNQGSEYNLDISQYSDSKYKPRQMLEIATGLVEGLDVSKCAFHECSWVDMEAIRILLERGYTANIDNIRSVNWMRRLEIWKNEKPIVQLVNLGVKDY